MEKKCVGTTPGGCVPWRHGRACTLRQCLRQHGRKRRAFPKRRFGLLVCLSVCLFVDTRGRLFRPLPLPLPAGNQLEVRRVTRRTNEALLCRLSDSLRWVHGSSLAVSGISKRTSTTPELYCLPSRLFRHVCSHPDTDNERQDGPLLYQP